MAMPENNFEEMIAPEVEVPKTVSAKAAFIAKCLHPPSAVNGFDGLPTNDTRSQVCVEYKGLSLLQFSGYPKDNPATGKIVCTPPSKRPTSFAFLIPAGGIRNVAFAFFKDTENGQWFQDLPNTIVNNVYNVNRVDTDVNLYRPTYKSLTTTLNCTMFNNTGMVAGSMFNPPLLWSGTLGEFAQQHPSKFLDFVRDLVATPSRQLVRKSKCKKFQNFPASVRLDIIEAIQKKIALSNPKSRNDVNNFTHLSLDEAFPNDELTLDLDPSSPIQFVFMGETSSNFEPVPTFDEMLNNDTRSAVFPAREGSFSINRLNTVSPAWLTPSNGRQIKNGLFSCYLSNYGADGAYHFVQLFAKTELNGNADDALDTQWSQDMTWQWIQYQGLSYNGNQDSVTQQQLLASKWICGYEYQPAFQSPFAGLQRLSPKPDLMAMEALLKDFYEFKSVLPSKYNFLGMLARGAAKLIPMITKHAPDIVKAITGVANFADEETRNDAKMRNDAVKKQPKAKAVRADAEKAIKEVKKGNTKKAIKDIKAVEADVGAKTNKRRGRNYRRKNKKGQSQPSSKRASSV